MPLERSVKPSLALRTGKWRSCAISYIEEPAMAAIASNHSKSMDYSYSGRALGEFGAGAAAAREIAGEPIIDLVHLARQTLSDQALEVELLDLFERQSARIVAQLRETRDADAKIRGDLAHTLRGSALSI